MEYLRGLKKYQLFRYTPTDPLEACRFITGEIERFNRGMGVSFFKRKHNFLNVMFVWGISTLMLYLCAIQTSAFQFRHDITKFMYCVATFGFGFQSLIKLYSYVITRRRVIGLYEMNLQYYKDMEQQSERVRDVLCENASLTYIVMKGTVLVYTMLVIATMIIPGLSSLFLSSRILPFGFILPLLNPETWTGYIWNYTFQLVIAYFYWLISVGSDITTIYNLLTAYGQLDTLMTIIEELEELLSRDEHPTVVGKTIVAIIQLHQRHRSYLQQLVDFLNPYHLVNLGFTVPTMAICVMGVVLLDWYPGLVLMFLGSVQIFFVCFLGTSLEIKTDALTLKVGAIHWNRLSVRDMKHMNLMLTMTQKPKALLLATTPLNITTFLRVTIHKLIYSMIMMLQNTKK